MKTRTILMLLVFAAQSLMTACSGQKGQYDKCLALDNDGYPLDLGYSMNISEDSINGFRLEFTRIDTTMSDTTHMITWVKLEKVEKTTDEHRTPADGDRFNTYLVENQYVYRGTAIWNGVHQCVRLISAMPLENYVLGKDLPIEEQDTMKNAIYILFYRWHKNPHYGGNYVYFLPLTKA